APPRGIRGRTAVPQQDRASLPPRRIDRECVGEWLLREANCTHLSRKREELRRKNANTGYTVGMSAELAETSPPTAKSGRRLALARPVAVGALILRGGPPPGPPTPRPARARSLNVSRTPRREAFGLLREEGLIENRPDQRAVVRRIAPAEIDAVYTARVM